MPAFRWPKWPSRRIRYMGIVEDKVIKNRWLLNIFTMPIKMKNLRRAVEDDTFGTITIAEPIGVFAVWFNH